MIHTLEDGGEHDPTTRFGHAGEGRVLAWGRACIVPLSSYGPQPIPSAGESRTRMVKKAAGILARLGHIGGAGSVAYDHHGNATVRIKDKNSGIVHTVHLGGRNGRMYSCPAGEHDKLSRYDLALGRIKLTQQPISRTLRTLDREYPGHTAPAPIVTRFNTLLRRYHRLVRAYNAEVDARNAVLKSDCTA
jgi:hypothetical protein